MLIALKTLLGLYIPDPVNRNGLFSIPTDRHSSNVLQFRTNQMFSRNLGSQINISMRYTRVDKTNTSIPSMRRVLKQVGGSESTIISRSI